MGTGPDANSVAIQTWPSSARVRRLTSPFDLKPKTIAELDAKARRHHFETACIAQPDGTIALIGVHDRRGRFSCTWSALNDKGERTNLGALLAESGRQKRHVNATELGDWLKGE